MSFRQFLALAGLLLLSGCLYHAREHTDAAVADFVSHPYDVAPSPTSGNQTPPPAPPATQPGAQSAPPGDAITAPKTETERTNAPSGADQQTKSPAAPKMDVQTTAYMQKAVETAPLIPENRPKMEPKIPSDIPGSEAKPIGQLPENEAAQQKAIQQLYPALPPLPTEPTPEAGPDGRPLTLADFQTMAAANSPDLRQAAADVEATRGLLIQSRTYPNPTVSLLMNPANDASQTSEWGVMVDQQISTAGKIKLASAAAEMDLRNAQLALRRARNDLSTRVRNAYYTLLVAKEMVRLNRAMARFTDDIYRLHAGLLQAGQIAPYEPMALKAQAYMVRLSHQQSIQAYIYAWKGMVATTGLRQMPLTHVEGRIDAWIPYYEYDKVLDHVLRNHTDVLTAKNGVDKAKYVLKLAQVTPIPNVEVNFAPQNEFAVFPKQAFNSAFISVPLPIWDKNKGNIIAAEAGLIRATEEPHRIDVNLTNSLATAYQGYKANLQGLDYFRHYILPDQIRTYRGVLAARQIDPGKGFSDLFNAQQTLSQDLTTYLGILGSLWSSVVSVADLLQTDDLFQLAQPQEVPGLPDLEHLPAFPCCHPGVGSGSAAPPSYQSYQSGAWPTQPASDPVATAIRGGQSSEPRPAETTGKAVLAGTQTEIAPAEQGTVQTPADGSGVVHAGTNP